MKYRISPRRPLSRELPTLAIAFAVPAILLALMPSAKVASEQAEKTPACVCSFVELDEATEERLLSAARAAWRVDGRDSHRRIDLFGESLPARPRVPALLNRETPVVKMPVVDFAAPDVLPPTMAAPRGAQLPVVESVTKRPRAFSRAEMLRIRNMK